MVSFTLWLARAGIVLFSNFALVAVGAPMETTWPDAVKHAMINACAAERGVTFSNSYAEISWGNSCILAFGSHYEKFTADPGRAYILALAAAADASHLCKECDELSANASALKDRLQTRTPTKTDSRANERVQTTYLRCIRGRMHRRSINFHAWISILARHRNTASPHCAADHWAPEKPCMTASAHDRRSAKPKRGARLSAMKLGRTSLRL
jgi:hypothetical protein